MTGRREVEKTRNRRKKQRYSYIIYLVPLFDEKRHGAKKIDLKKKGNLFFFLVRIAVAKCKRCDINLHTNSKLLHPSFKQ